MTALRPLCVVLCACLAAATASAQGVTLSDAHYVELENGAVFILHQKPDVPLVGVKAVIRGGAVTDPDGKSGMSSLLAGMLEKGTASRDTAAFAEAIDAVGGSLSAAAGLESITISAEFLSRDLDLMIELLVDMLQAPTLGYTEMKKLRDRRINLIRAAKDSDLRSLIPIYGNAFLFGEQPYGTTVNGNEASLAKISQRELRRHYENFFGADRLIIAIAGDFDAAAMSDTLSAAFSGWRRAATPLPEFDAPVPQEGRRVLLVDKPGATQSYFWIGNVGVGIGYPQRAELDIANTLFGGRFTSLLMDELRTKAGLTYGARSNLLRASKAGSVAINSYTKTETTLEAIDLALSLLTKLHEEGFADDLILSAKNYILGQFPPRLETAKQLAAQFANLELHGLDASYVNSYGDAITAADGEAIRAVIDSVYPMPDNLVFVILGDAELIRDDIAKYGPVTEIAITEPRFRP